MNIQGIQKLTLLDYPGKVACTVFTGGCNFRCPFCHNAILVTGDIASNKTDPSEIISFLKKRTGILDGVCITGGEPLINPDISAFIKSIKELGYSVKLDTNGSFPDKLKGLVNEGIVDYVAMDIKNTPEKYGFTVGKEHFDFAPVLESVDFLKEGKIPYEFRTTVTLEHHTVEDIKAIGKWLEGAPKYYLQNFVDSGELIDKNIHGHDKSAMNSMLLAVKEYIPNAELRGI